LEAVRDILRSLDETNVELLRERTGVETDPAVKKEIDTGLALAALDGTDPQARLDAITVLSGGLSQDARNKLAPGGQNRQQFAQRRKSGRLRNRHKTYRSMAHLCFASTALFWISLGSVLVLVAMGSRCTNVMGGIAWLTASS
jgi:hypothetical protein